MITTLPCYRSKKESWARDAALTSETEVEKLKCQLREAVSQTEEIRGRLEEEFKENLNKANEEYQGEVDKLLAVEYEKSSDAEKR